MGVTLEINFDSNKGTYSPGDAIQGTVTLRNDDVLKVKGLVLRLYGEASVYWTETDAGEVVGQVEAGSATRRLIHKEYTNQETLFSHEIVLMGQAEDEGGTDTVLTPGVKKYWFQFQFPKLNTPSTLNLPYGSIKYFAEARLKKRLFSYDHVEKEFIIKDHVDLSLLPNALEPVGATARLDFGFLCCRQGYVNAVLKIDKAGYTPGEIVEFMVSVVNLSYEPISRILIALTQTVEYSTHGKRKVESTDLRRVWINTREDGVPNWNESIPIPNGIPATTVRRNALIRVTYDVTLTLRIWDRTSIASCPIIIGTNCELSPRSSTSEVGQDMDSVTQIHGYDPSMNPFLEPEMEAESLQKTDCLNETGQTNFQDNGFYED